MWPVIGGLLSGGASLLGSMFSSETSAQNTSANIQAQEQMQQQTEAFNASQTQQQEQFQQQMSSTAYQRAATDMKAAGLNPILAAGASESTPSGAAASVGTPNVSNINQRTSSLAGVGDAVSKSISTAKELQSLSNDTAKAAAQVDLDVARTGNVQVDTGTKHAAMPGVIAASKSKELDVSSAQNEAQRATNEYQARSTTAGKLADQAAMYGRAASQTLSPVTDLISSAKGVKQMMPQRSTSETTHDDGSSSFNERWSY